MYFNNVMDKAQVTSVQIGQMDRMDKWTDWTNGQIGQTDRTDKWTEWASGQMDRIGKRTVGQSKWAEWQSVPKDSREEWKDEKMTEDNCRIGYPKSQAWILKVLLKFEQVFKTGS